MAAKLEERCGVLESLIEPILLPVVGVIGELDSSLDICVTVSHTYQVKIQLHYLTKVDMIQKPQVKRCTDSELLVLGKNNMTAIIAVLDSL